MNKKKVIFLVILIVLIIGLMWRCSNSDQKLTKNKLEEQIKDVSNGEMVLNNPSTKKGKAIYETTSADLDDKIHIMYFSNSKDIITAISIGNILQAEMNEIDFGNLARYADILIEIVEPALSTKERDDLLNNQLKFQENIFNGNGETSEVVTDNAKYTFFTEGNLYNFIIKFDEKE